MIKSQARFALPVVSFDWLLAILFIALFFISSGRLVLTNWLPDLGVILVLALLGAVLGLALGVSRFSGRAQGWLMIAYSLVFVPSLLAGAVQGEKSFAGQLLSLLGRLGVAYAQFTRREPVEVPVFFITLAGLIFWWMGILCGRELMRKQRILWVLLPPTIPLLIVQYHDAARSERFLSLALFFFVALALLGRLNFLKSLQNWQESRVFVAPKQSFDLGSSIFVVSAFLVIVVWAAPPPMAALPAAARWWVEASEEWKPAAKWLEDILAAVRQPRGAPGELYGNTLALGSVADQGAGVVFIARPSINTASGRFYWRARVYDIYQNGNWSNARLQTRQFTQAEDSLLPIPPVDGDVAVFSFDWQGRAQVSLVLPPNTIWASRAGEMVFSPLGRDNLVDLFTLRALPQVQTGDQYTAQAYVLRPTLKVLRAAGTEYPSWVLARYLQMPEALLPRFRALAQEITRGKETPYDQAQAITTYLRENMEYKLTVQPPPSGVDPAEWFLFTWKSGYCNYYATSQVLLLRSIGIPARLAAGYAEGVYNNQQYLVRTRDAHAWPEVYFPQVGWVEFEPTSSQRAIFRLSGEDVSNIPRPGNPTPDPDELLEIPVTSAPRQTPVSSAPTGPQGINLRWLPNLDNLWVRTVLQWVIMLMLLATFFIVSWQMGKRKAWSKRAVGILRAFYKVRGSPAPVWLENLDRWVSLGKVERAFHSINQCLAWLQKPAKAHLTPAERASSLCALLPDAEADIRVLEQQYSAVIYGQKPGEPSLAARASWNIRFFTLRAVFRRRMTGV